MKPKMYNMPVLFIRLSFSFFNDTFKLKSIFKIDVIRCAMITTMLSFTERFALDQVTKHTESQMFNTTYRFFCV